MFYAPLGRDVVEAIDAVDSRFITATVCPVIAGDKTKLAKLRALLCIDSPRMARRLAAQQFKSRTAQTAEDEAMSEVTRDCARLVLRDLPQVRGMAYLVGEEDGAARGEGRPRRRGRNSGRGSLETLPTNGQGEGS